MKTIKEWFRVTLGNEHNVEVNNPKRLVYTTLWGEYYEKLSKTTHPLIKSYAKKHNAEFLIIDENKRKYKGQASFEDFQLPSLLKQYDEIVHLDTDLVISTDTPWLLTHSHGMMCAVDESYFGPRSEVLERYASVTENPILDGRYFNFGVFGITTKDATVWDTPIDYYDDGMGCQTFINYRLIKLNHPIRDLGPEFNSMCYSWNKYDIKTNYVTHFAGNRDFEFVEKQCKKIIDVWKSNNRV